MKALLIILFALAARLAVQKIHNDNLRANQFDDNTKRFSPYLAMLPRVQ